MIKTLQQVRDAQREQLDRLIAIAGSEAHLARMLNIPQTTISGWIARGRISRRGARVVCSHVTLGQFFTVDQLMGVDHE